MNSIESLASGGFSVSAKTVKAEGRHPPPAGKPRWGLLIAIPDCTRHANRYGLHDEETLAESQPDPNAFGQDFRQMSSGARPKNGGPCS